MTGQEDKNQDTNIALLQQDMNYLKKQIDDISNNVKKLAEKEYITRPEILTLQKDAEKEHIRLNDEIQSIRLNLEVFKTQVKTWGAAAVLALGILQYAISIFIK